MNPARNSRDQSCQPRRRWPSMGGESKVVLIHGLGGGKWMMRRAGSYLAEAGFGPDYWGYRWLGKGIPGHAEKLRAYLTEQLKRHERLHVVAHSLGAILFRAATVDLPQLDRFRLVMLGPPNHGSPVAKFLGRRIGFLCPALAELSDEDHSLVRSLPTQVPKETGIIAAARDNVVVLESAWLAEVREREIVDCRHGMLPFDARVHALVKHFLTHGTFAQVPLEGRHVAGESQPCEV